MRHIILGVSVVAVMASVSASAAVIVGSAKELSSASNVRRWAPQYDALTAAQVAYDQCGSDYAITEAQRSYLSEQFSQVSSSYVQSYHDEYVARVGYMPTQGFMDEVGKLLRKRQQQVVNQMALQIQQTGCRNKIIGTILTYPEKYRYMSQPGLQTQGED